MTGEDIVGLHGVHISQTIWRGEWLAKAIDKEIASRAAAANEALDILREATGRTDYRDIVEAAREAARMLTESQVHEDEAWADRHRMDRLEALPGIAFTYRPHEAKMPLSLRSEIDAFFARMDEGK